MDKIVKNLGGDRLGSGSKMEVQMHNYERSTHDLSRAWRSTMAPGTLIPFFQEIALNGDTWDIDLQAMVRTLPTVGPLFGSYKLQLDVFQCPLRLYNGILHNNATKIGMEIEKVLFPKIVLNGGYVQGTRASDEKNSLRTSTSSLVNYLGIKGLGMPSKNATYQTSNNGEKRTSVVREFFADGVLAYWDIFKNYYANKQEEKAYVIGQDEEYAEVHSISIIDGEEKTNTTSTTSPYGRRITGGSSATRPVVVSTTGQTTTREIVNIPASKFIKTNPQPILTQPYEFKVGQSIIIYHDPIKNIHSITLKYQQSAAGTQQTLDTLETDYPWLKVTPLYNSRNTDQERFSKTKITFVRELNSEEEKVPSHPNKFYGASIVQNYETLTQNIALVNFPLENIDTMREQILATSGKNTQIFLNETSKNTNVDASQGYKTSKVIGLMPYSQICKVVKDGNQNTLITSNQNPLNGIAVKTYQSDIYNNWLNSEWIQGTQGNSIQEITAISTQDGSFTIDELILAKKVYDMLNRIAISGGTYEDWQEAVYGEEAMKRAESPIYCGGMSQEIEFEEIVSSSQTSVNNEEKALGTLAGKGTLNPHTRKGGSITIKIKEPSLIIGIVSITPRIDYSQGNDWLVNLKSLNDLHKPALDGIGFQDLIAEQMAWWTTVVEDNASNNAVKNSTITQQAIGKQPAWINYQTSVSQVYGEFAEESKRYMTLQRQYEELILMGQAPKIADATTYIDPSKYNYAFANQELTSQNFWVNIGIKAIARRKMSAKLMPNL